MYIPLLPLAFLNLKILRGTQDSLEKFKFYRRGSHALAAILHSLKPKGFRTVLLPAYICASVVKSIRMCGFNLRFYKINEDMKIKEIPLREQRNILLLVHYFGFPQPVERLASICKNDNIFLIEDCAHAPLTTLNGRRLGEFGDASIFSLWKVFPVPDGGALLVNSKINVPSPSGKAGSAYMIRILLKEWVRLICWKLQVPPVWIAKYPSRDQLERRRREAFMKNPTPCFDIKSISSISRRILKSVDFNEIAIRRRRNFTFWLENLPRSPKVKPVYEELPEGVVPFSFPVIVSNRDEIREELRRRGIYLGAGFPESPVVPEGMEGKFKVSQYLARNLLELPVHQSLDVHHLRKVLEHLVKVLKKV